jgi:hypothetical protein
MALTLTSWLSGETITILIGKKEHRFVVEKNKLCVKSKLIRIACAPGRWLEGHDMVVRLPEVESQTLFKRYLSWICTDMVTIKETTATEPESMKMNLLIKLYLLGDYLDDVRLRNVTIRALTMYATCPSIQECNMIFEQTPPASPLRKWTVDAIISLADRHTFERLSVLYDLDLTLQIAIMLMHQRPNTGLKRRLSEREAKKYVTSFWGFAMSAKDGKLRELAVEKIASGLTAETFEQAGAWSANLTLQLACKLMHQRSHNGTDIEGLVERAPGYEEATTASDFGEV